MSAKNSGGPAFPVVAEQDVIEMGMTLRDYFAAKAMQGELSAMVDPDGKISGLDISIPDESLSRLTKHWFRIADAMLKAREA